MASWRGRRIPLVLTVAGLILRLGAVRGHDVDEHDRLPPDASAVLDEAESVELLSIDPRDRPGKADDSFHGWKVLGRTYAPDASGRRAILASVKQAIGETDGVSGCFEPRHGLRATKGGRSVDLVICFSCRWIEVRSEGKTSFVWTSDAPKSAFNNAPARGGRQACAGRRGAVIGAVSPIVKVSGSCPWGRTGTLGVSAS